MEKSTRELALAWWKKFCYDCELNDNHDLIDDLIKKHISIPRNYNLLTGREIEEIWRKENPIAALPDELINTDFDGIEEEHHSGHFDGKQMSEHMEESLYKDKFPSSN